MNTRCDQQLNETANRSHLNSVFFSLCLTMGFVPGFLAKSIATEGTTPADASKLSAEKVADSAAPSTAATSSSSALPVTSQRSVSSQLSVAPLDHVEYPADRPKWVSAAPDFESSQHSWSVVTPPCDLPEDANDLLRVLMRATVASYIQQVTGETAEKIEFAITDEWIERELVAKRYEGKLLEGDSTRHEQAALLEFSPLVRDNMLATWKNHEVSQRLAVLGLGVTGLLGMLALGSSVLSVVGCRMKLSKIR